MKTRPYLVHALSPLHAGTGQAIDIIDLPIARMRATGIPFVPGSSIKGVLREARSGTLPLGMQEAIFGPPQKDAASHAGALIVGDARLLALPVRSFRGTFAWVSSPLLLSLARRDSQEGGMELPAPPALTGTVAIAPTRSLNVHGKGNAQRVYLEDLDLPVSQQDAVALAAVQGWAGRIAAFLGAKAQGLDLVHRFLVVDDETMSFLLETATQIDTRVRIDENTRTVADKALWSEESLPPETLLLGLVAADRSRKAGVELLPERVLQLALHEEQILQFGGKATVGRGRCRMMPLGAQEGT